MTTAAAPATDRASRCPLHAGVQRDSVLVLPLHRRLVLQYAQGDDGATELRLYHDRHEISFDDANLFAFGETLASRPHFVAGEATGWGSGYDWTVVQPMLQQLLDAGVLRLARPGEDLQDRPTGVDDGARPSPLPPAPADAPRSWHDADTVMRELTGRGLDPSHLELVLPIFRVAHMALDADGRQVGEANVFPPALRLPVDTRWRQCIYPGTRYRSDRPMNVSALKAMRAHWGAMMALVLAVRQAYLARYPDAAQGWTVGHLERLSTAVLALPTWLLMRPAGRVANGELHPALSSLFRVTDGVRMTMHQMLFVPIGEPALDPDTPMTAAALHAYAERNHGFHSEHGVCAGPQAMVDDFLSVLVDGRPPRDGLPARLDDAVLDAMQAIEPALDYGLRGLQAYAVVFSLWPQMARTYEQLAGIAQAWADDGCAAAAVLQQRLAGHVQRLQRNTYLGTEERRRHRDRVYADMLARCTHGLAGEPAAPPLAQRLQPRAQPADRGARHALLRALRRHAGPGHDRHRLAFAGAVLHYLRFTRALLGEAQAVQAGINRLLGRPAPQQPLTAAELDLHNQLQGAAQRHLPYLIDELQAVLGIAITVTPQHIGVTVTESTGGVPGDHRVPVGALN